MPKGPGVSSPSAAADPELVPGRWEARGVRGVVEPKMEETGKPVVEEEGVRDRCSGPGLEPVDDQCREPRSWSWLRVCMMATVSRAGPHCNFWANRCARVFGGGPL